MQHCIQFIKREIPTIGFLVGLCCLLGFLTWGALKLGGFDALEAQTLELGEVLPDSGLEGWTSPNLAESVPSLPEGFTASAFLPAVYHTTADATDDAREYRIAAKTAVVSPKRVTLPVTPAAYKPAALHLNTQAGAAGKTPAQCLALNLYHEARGEGVAGMAAVAVVTNNRVANTRWPQTVCGVVYEPWQFSWTMDKASDMPADLALYDQAYAIAQAALGAQNGYSKAIINAQAVLKGADHYYAPRYVSKPRWADKYHKIIRVGVHDFYRS